MKTSVTIVTPGADRERTVELGTDDVCVGRSSRSTIRIPTRSVSGRHLTLRYDDGRWTVTDEHSTNGTKLNGEPLVPGEPHALDAGDVIELNEVRLEFDLARKSSIDALTLQETGTLARQLASDLLLEASDDDLARVEIDGPNTSRTRVLEDSLTRAFVGRDDDCLISLDQLDAPRLLEISRVRDGFGVRPVDVTGRDSVALNGTPLSSKTALSDGDTIEAGPYSMRFYDPLESILVDLEDHPAPAAADDATPEQPELQPPDDHALGTSTPEPAPQPSQDQPEDPPAVAQSGLTATEWTILVIALVLMTVAAALLLTVFDVV